MGRQARLKKERRAGRDTREREKRERAEHGEKRGCLICRRSDGGFTTDEHVLPESMGNTQVVLPNGVVCEACNGGSLSDLDQALCEFFPLKMRRTMLGIRSKAGNIPVTRFGTGAIRSTGDDSLTIEINNANDKKTFHEKRRVGNAVELGFQVTGGKRMTPRYGSMLSRALLKSMLECAWLDHGEMMLEQRFDHVRAAILGEPRNGFLVVGRHADPNDNGTELTYNFAQDAEGRERMWVVADYYGVALATDSRLPQPPDELPEEHSLVLRFSKGDLRAAA